MNIENTPFALDSNILLYAISSGINEGPDNNSILDRKTRTHSKKIRPEQVRGAIISLLLEHPVIIPEIVLKELKGNKIQSMLSEKNKQSLERIVQAIGNRQISFTPQRIDVIRHNYTINNIKEKANAFVLDIKNQGINIPDNWEQELSPQKGRNDPPLSLLENNQYCMTWAKIAPEEARVKKNIKVLPPSGDTEQQQLLAEAKEIRERLDKPETTQEELEELTSKLAILEIKAQETKPYFIPDFEIFFLAKSHKAMIYSLDNDIALMESELQDKGGPRVPILTNTTGPWATIEDLAHHIKKNLNRQSLERTKKTDYANLDPIS